MADQNLNKVQPIDNYVRGLLQNATRRGVVIRDLNRPTRAERLEAALAMSNESDGWPSIEIMVGCRVDARDPRAQTLSFLQMTQKVSPRPLREFYDGFTHQYEPNLTADKTSE